jgi:hypothetical protein
MNWDFVKYAILLYFFTLSCRKKELLYWARIADAYSFPIFGFIPTGCFLIACEFVYSLLYMTV